jgi:DNA-binding response OmpR family regulator
VRILLVEDDLRVAAALETALRQHGHEVVGAATAAEALTAPPVDLVLLDLGLPDRDGIEVCRELRARSDVAIIAVTARAEERERVLGLRSGADDYVVKPFGMAELQARIEAVMRRTRRLAATRPNFRIGGLEIDVDARRVTVSGREITLTARSSSCSRRWPGGRGTPSPGSSCWPRCGAPPGGAACTPLRCTWPRCAASSATAASSRRSVASGTGCGQT